MLTIEFIRPHSQYHELHDTARHRRAIILLFRTHSFIVLSIRFAEATSVTLWAAIFSGIIQAEKKEGCLCNPPVYYQRHSF